MRHFFVLILAIGSFINSNGQREKVFQENRTVTWGEAREIYRELADEHEWASYQQFGFSDVGKPLEVFIIEKDRTERGGVSPRKSVLLINNGIHPGEPCGVDASIQLVRRLLSGNERYTRLLDSVVVAVIPIYNIGGALNRSSTVRANQNGPEEYGFRGNARNLDLNRDFIKCDSRNAASFAQLYHALRPHVFVDTHTSNGADYQYIMTMIATQPDKAGEAMGSYIREKMNPALFEAMEADQWEMTPYVFTRAGIPDEGIQDFLETPRYSTGYTALFNTIGFTSETHMLKPFPQRVESTYRFLLKTMEYMHEHNSELIQLKKEADEMVSKQKEFELDWEIDTTQYRMIPFKGYEATYPTSDVTGFKRLKYDHSKPFLKEIRYYDVAKATATVEAPLAYVLPQQWREVVERMNWNNVEMTRIPKDTTIMCEVYYLSNYRSASRAYEGHHFNTLEELTLLIEEVDLYAGDYLIRVNQPTNRYIVETLEPQGVDAFFVWNFFDSALQQKEWYSDYVFEDTAAELLLNNKELAAAFEKAKKEDPELAANPSRQLYWIYMRSPYYEGTVNRYPIFRLNQLPEGW